MYLCDTWVRRIYRFEFDLVAGMVGTRTSPRTRGSPTGSPSMPKGSSGTHYDGGCSTRYAVDGAIVQVLRMLVRHVTSLAFGGADLRTLYVTSASMRLSAEERQSQPLAGHVFAIEPGVAGLPEPCFAG